MIFLTLLHSYSTHQGGHKGGYGGGGGGGGGHKGMWGTIKKSKPVCICIPFVLSQHVLIARDER